MRPLLLACWFLALILPTAADTDRCRKINAGKEGQTLDVTAHLIPGKTNIIDFYSEYCPPCRAFAPYLKELAKRDPKVAVGKVDINRPGKRGIDWKSPVARQYKLDSVPHFMVYDGKGKLIAEGVGARKMVLKLMEKAGIQ